MAAAEPLRSLPKTIPDSRDFSAFDRSRAGAAGNNVASAKQPAKVSLREKPAEHYAKAENRRATPVRSNTEVKKQALKTKQISGRPKIQDHSTKQASYVVLPGETLWAVARKHAVDVRQLAKWNDISENTKVQAGQKLVLWNKDGARKLLPVAAGIRPSQSISYTVKAGDTLFSISRRFKVSVADLRRSNGSNVDKKMQPGRSITVPK